MRQLSGVVLAAGRSSRMGRDKALLEIDGVPLWQRQRDVLVRAGVREIFLSARPDQAWARRATGFAAVVHDALPDCGPLVGLTAGLERAMNPWVAVLAVDMAHMEPEWYGSLWSSCTPGVGMVGRKAEHYEPLAAIYPREAMFPAWEGLTRAEYSVQGYLAACVARGLMRVRTIEPADAPLFANWNSPEDLAAPA